jgi:hypothetical protein
MDTIRIKKYMSYAAATSHIQHMKWLSRGNIGIQNFTALDITTVSLLRIGVTTLNNFMPFNQMTKNILNDKDVKENPIQNSTFTLSNDTV